MVFLLVFFCLNYVLAFSQAASQEEKTQTKTCDVNKDGKPDVTYYSDSEGKNVAKVEADTDYNGRPDVVVILKDGKFDSAEVDTNNDGKSERKFNDASEFNKWVNENRPDFNNALNRPNWRFGVLAF
jgi:hypothetical protein